MELRRLDDYQSWQVCLEGSSLLIDPWLTAEPITGSFTRRHTAGYLTVQDVLAMGCTVDGVLLCTAVNDHTRPASLKALAESGSEPTVLGPRRAVRIARRAGLADGRVVRPGGRHEWRTRSGGTLTVTATRTGLPLGLIAVGYLIDGFDSTGTHLGRIWIEPHRPPRSVASRLAPVDIAVLPTQSVTAVVISVTAGPVAVARAARAADSRMLVPTATDPRRDMSAWQRATYQVAGGDRDLQSALGEVTMLTPMNAGGVQPIASRTTEGRAGVD